MSCSALPAREFISGKGGREGIFLLLFSPIYRQDLVGGGLVVVAAAAASGVVGGGDVGALARDDTRWWCGFA